MLEQDTSSYGYAAVKQAAFYISTNLFGTIQPKIGLVLGSGLGDFVHSLEDSRHRLYRDVPYFPPEREAVPGHAGELWAGVIGGKPVVAMRGRYHYYQGYTLPQVVLPVRALIESGIETLIITNAAGGLSPDYKVGDLVALRAHLNIPQLSPLIGKNEDGLGVRFPPMNNAYDSELSTLTKQQADRLGVRLHTGGVYAWMVGPQYEMPEEIEMVRRLGGTLVGMSTVPEVIAVRHMATIRPRVRILGISCVTNLAAGLSETPPSHEEVTETGRLVQESFSQLIISIIQHL